MKDDKTNIRTTERHRGRDETNEAKKNMRRREFMEGVDEAKENTNKRPDTQHQLKVQITHHIQARVSEQASERVSGGRVLLMMSARAVSLMMWVEGWEGGHVYTTPSSAASTRSLKTPRP
ncbi:hypothetical protein Pcinc_043390 [Petrolisthes cinctipes]|uniref:Uncharacterized protein n=1 Tax=Petrolisthes cinctipes TaxID=88211 RepID=A0AAE1BFZ8_PETCI|nr:hypothetical protein Pcinc_043390 [Petrolisthes cinctipes]